MTSYEFNRVTALGFTAAAAITTAVYYNSTNTTNKQPSVSLAILIFQDQGEQYSQYGGLKPDAVTIRCDDSFPVSKPLEYLKKTASLACDGGDNIRLFIQATKEEIKNDQDVVKLISSKGYYNGLTAAALISTTNGENLSKEAVSGEPLKHFSPPSGVRDLSWLGLGHKAAYTGDNLLPLRNAFNNLFKNKEEKTVLIQRPLPSGFAVLGVTDNSEGCDYIPTNEYGVLITVDPNMADELMKRQPNFVKTFDGPGQQKLNQFGDFGIFSSSTNSESWKTAHGVLPKFFNSFKMKNYFPIILKKTESFLSQWVKKGRTSHIKDVNDWLTSMTADAVVKAAMDYDMNNVERMGNNEEVHAFITAFRYCIAHCQGKTTPRDEEMFLKQKKVSEEFVQEIVESTRKGEIGGPLSLITGMLEAKASSNGEYVKLADFFGHCISLMVAGHETTAATIGFCLAELSTHPDAMAKVMKEIEEVLGEKSAPTYEDINKLTYLDACFKEALRMQPPVQNFPRACQNDSIVLGNILIRKGQKVDLIVAGLHRDPEQWDQGTFGDVETFNPDRHLPGAPPRHQSAMLPFGYGVRGCIGMQFALLEAKTFLSMALNFFKIETPQGFVPLPYMGHGAAPTCKDLSFDLSYRTGGPLSRVDVFNNDKTEEILGE